MQELPRCDKCPLTRSISSTIYLLIMPIVTRTVFLFSTVPFLRLLMRKISCRGETRRGIFPEHLNSRHPSFSSALSQDLLSCMLVPFHFPILPDRNSTKLEVSTSLTARAIATRSHVVGGIRSQRRSFVGGHLRDGSLISKLVEFPAVFLANGDQGLPEE